MNFKAKLTQKSRSPYGLRLLICSENNLDIEDLLTKAGQNVVTSAHALDEAMVNALANGYTVQDICNIKSAEFAYKANCSVFKSTFEISV